MLIFLDIETTGLETKDRICSIGWILHNGNDVRAHHELIRPPRKIPPSASALHHITNEMVAAQPLFESSKSVALLQELNSPETVLVSHNAAFELEMLQKEGIVWQGKIVDTLKCSRHIIAECEQYALQFLRYELKLYQKETSAADALKIDIAPHNALSDALHVKLLYEYLLESATPDELIEMSCTHALITRFTFGKYRGRYIEEIALKEPGYLQWMLNNMVDIDEDLRYSLEHYLAQS